MFWHCRQESGELPALARTRRTKIGDNEELNLAT